MLYNAQNGSLTLDGTTMDYIRFGSGSDSDLVPDGITEEDIVFLEKECKDGFHSALAETEDRIMKKLDSIEKRISYIENQINNCDCDDDAKPVIQAENASERFKAELSDFHSELEGVKSLLSK